MNTAVTERTNASTPWHAVVLSPEQVAKLEHSRLEDEFELMYRSAGSPRAVALFVLKSFSNYPMYYFTPDASRIVPHLIGEYDGIPCNPPSPDDVLLIEGDTSATLMLAGRPEHTGSETQH